MPGAPDLWGPSRSGKTRFALSDIFGTKPLTVDVGDGQDLNLQSWDHRVHSHLVLDNVNASDVIMRWRLQNVPNNFAIGLKPFLSSDSIFIHGANHGLPAQGG